MSVCSSDPCKSGSERVSEKKVKWEIALPHRQLSPSPPLPSHFLKPKTVADWTQKEIFLHDLGQLYQDLAGEWLLLEILEGIEKKLPTKFCLHAHSQDKDKLREFMMEHEDWDWSRKFLIVQADPEKPCEISSSSRL